MPKVILVSTFPLPYSKIGSWTTMYRNYLESKDHRIDYLVCEEPDERLHDVDYWIASNSFLSKIKRRLSYYRNNYLDAIFGNMGKGETYIVQFVDNFHMAERFHKKAVQKGVRANCYIQLFYHGFDPFIESSGSNAFYENVDELILLTHDSYRYYLSYYSSLPTRVSILHNGIDTSRFHKVDAAAKARIRKELGITADKVFIWCSQDRPKKGLAMILDAWTSVIAQHPGHELLVAGVPPKGDFKNVRFLGRVPNDSLPQYYQASDCYLFPTLWHEGFGLSLIEALNCGCHCIASHQGGVPEVLQYGKLGRLIENPNFVSEWENAIIDFITGKDTPIVIDEPVYTQQQWMRSMNAIIDTAKKKLS